MPTLFILAGGDISNKLPHLHADFACPALIPVNTRPLAAYALEFYRGMQEIHLFVDELFVEEVIRELQPSRHGFTLHGVKRGLGVVDTLQQALDTVDADDVIVNLVTTIPVSIPELHEVQGGRLPAHSITEWSALSRHEEHLTFYAKGTERPGDALAFTGIFRLPASELKVAVAAAQRRQDLLSVIEAAAARTPLHLKEVDWVDCGHEANYYKSRASLINSRSFNRLKVDTHCGTITKFSSDKEKLAREVSYLQTLPLNLRILFPRLVSVSGSTSRVDSYEMEYYGYPNLAEYLIYWDISKESWWRCFDGLNATLSLFREHPASIGPQSYYDFHWIKTHTRIQTYLSSLTDPVTKNILSSSSLIINGKVIPPLTELLSAAEIVISQSYRESEFGAVHGDFCFNNILFDVTSGIVRLIDPRGSFGATQNGVIGDWRYDLAKLSHSSIGHYDYIVNGLYELIQEQPDVFLLRIELRKNAVWLEEMTRWLINEQKANPREISVMTALLFLSMCPLHSEDAQRQLAFFLRGLELLTQSLE